MRLVVVRFTHNALALLAVTTILFFMFRLMPGTPLAAFISENLNADQQQAMLEQFGPQMICVNSASDWGESGPSNLTDTCLEYLSRGHSEAEVTEIFYNNPCRFFGQGSKWKLKPAP